MEVLVEMYKPEPTQKTYETRSRTESDASKHSALLQGSVFGGRAATRRPFLISYIRWFARIGIPFFVIAFIICYWITALKIYVVPSNNRS